ncbi:hypothetical protein MKW92_021301 [Papaver armeniacum]|nr:hypothetical protein MKW92_021301 [Papaver armeniacum]
MSGIYNHLVRVFGKNLRNERPSSEEDDDQSRLLELTEIQTNEDEPGHYQHGIPGFPTDGKVVLLKNSNNGALVYLIGTVHGSEQSAATVKQVIGDIKPDVVAVEQCETRATRVMNWKPEDDAIRKVFCKSMRAPGGLCLKFGLFYLNLKLRRLRANGITPELEFKVAIEESISVEARCVYIDQDIDVMLQNFVKASPLELFRNAYNTRVKEVNGEGCTRSSVRKRQSGIKELRPKLFQVMTEDRDMLMFTKLRGFEGKVVAVVGMGHMDGIEQLWKRAEEDDNSGIRQI